MISNIIENTNLLKSVLIYDNEAAPISGPTNSGIIILTFSVERYSELKLRER